MTDTDGRSAALARAAEAASDYKGAQERRALALIAAHAAGASWAEIGTAVGMVRSGVHQLADRYRRAQAA